MSAAQSLSSPPLKDSTTYDSMRTLHEVDPSTASTLVTKSRLPYLPHNPPGSGKPRNWVPEPELPGRARTLILFFDGTGDQFDDDNSNVVNFLACLKKDDQSQQLVYYQAGIGTYTNSNFVTPLSSQISKTLDEMIAWNLAEHVQQGYEFLMQNYTAGDKISIFGFSRGAYTARALCGMVQKVGLLPACNVQQIPFAYAMFTREDEDGLRNSEGFKKTFSIDVKIDFVGVWETVASVGITNKELPFVGNNTAIRIFRQALSLDEHRAKFMPNFYHESPNADPRKATNTVGVSDTVKKLDAEAAEAAEALAKPKVQAPVLGSIYKNGKGKRNPIHRSESEEWEAEINSREAPTDTLEVWFAGCHCDIGGGSVSNNTRNVLARIPLRWMIRECFRMETGIIFDKDMLRENIGIDADKLYPVVLQRPPRIPAPAGVKLAKMASQGLGITSFFKLVGSLLAIPITFVFSIITWPIKHIWLLAKFTTPLKWIRKKLGFKNWSKKSDKGSDSPSEETPLIPKQSTILINNFKSEEDEELNDALQPEYDQLSIRWGWWILELLPMRFREQKGRRDDYFVRANLGQGRKIYGDARKAGLKIHRSVKTRLEAVDRNGKSVYQPRAWFTHKDPITKKRTVVRVTNKENPDPKAEWEWVD